MPGETPKTPPKRVNGAAQPQPRITPAADTALDTKYNAAIGISQRNTELIPTINEKTQKPPQKAGNRNRFMAAKRERTLLSPGIE